MRISLIALGFMVAMPFLRTSSAEEAVVWIGKDKPALGNAKGFIGPRSMKILAHLVRPRWRPKLAGPSFWRCIPMENTCTRHVILQTVNPEWQRSRFPMTADH